MYVVMFPSGRTLSLSTKALAETYILAYFGKLISEPENESITNPEVIQK